MIRRQMVSLAAASLCLGAVLVTANLAKAAPSDSTEIGAAIQGFHAALESRDLNKMEAVWAHETYALLVTPRDKTVTVGWDNVRKSWETTFNFWAELKIQVIDAPHIRINGNVAWADSSVVAIGKSKAGADIKGATFESYVFERRGRQWLLVSHNAWRMPQ